MPQLLIATNGLSVWSSDDLGQTIERMPSSTAMYSGTQAWSMSPRGATNRKFLVGTDSGLYEFDRDTGMFAAMQFPMEGVRLITSLAVAPSDPNVIYAGTQPAGVFCSSDGGNSWRRADVPMKPYTTLGFYADGGAAESEAPVKHWTRVTSIAVDRHDPKLAWAGVEIDGFWRTRDGGETWQRLESGLVSQDIHCIVQSQVAGGRLIVATAGGPHFSEDGGDTLHYVALESPVQYVRTVVELPGTPGSLLVTNGDGPPGNWGKLFRSENQGESWNEVSALRNARSSLYFLCVNAADPQLVFAASALGQIYTSTDAGTNWTEMPRRLGEVRGLLWLP